MTEPAVHWNPDTYARFADERSRPFFDLVRRIPEGTQAGSVPLRVVDLGCGSGELTATCASRWPDAHVLGVDSSPQMIERAQALASERVRFVQMDLRDWIDASTGQADPPADVIISNAALQWVPEHRALLPRLLRALVPGGWLAFQVPGNFGEPSHQLLRALAREPDYASYTAAVAQPDSAGGAAYLADVIDGAATVDVWETSYLHVLPGLDPVFHWISGTGARPVLQALPPTLRDSFEATYKARLAEAYPAGPSGTVLPFRRIFVIAQRASGSPGVPA